MAFIAGIVAGYTIAYIANRSAIRKRMNRYNRWISRCRKAGIVR